MIFHNELRIYIKNYNTNWDYLLFQVVHLPSYVESLSNIVGEVDPPVEPAVLLSIERIVVHLIKQFPKLPEQYHPFAIRAFSSVRRIFMSS